MKKIYIIGLVAILITIITVITITVVIKDKEKPLDPINNDFKLIGVFEESVIDEENYVFTNYEDYKSKFDSSDLTLNDFEKNNYVLVSMRYDACSESDVTPIDYKINGSKIDVIIEYKARCGVCAPEYMYYLLKVDKAITSADVNIEYNAINNIRCDQYVAYKPIIYLYPTSTADISVKLSNAKYLTTTYPKYNNSWEVTANPDGTLIDKKTGRSLYGLYWEGNNHMAKMEKDGFVIKGEDTIEFLEEKLSILGLNEREANEFIIYWLPKLESNKYNYIRFETIDEINNYMPLNISPKPDTLIRVMMDYKPLDKKIIVEEQELITQERIGFTVVEWGGSPIN